MTAPDLAQWARSALRPAISQALASRGFFVAGSQWLPQPGERVIVACNHAAFVDTVYLLTAIPTIGAVIGARPHHFCGVVRRAVLALGSVQCIPDEAAFADRGRAWLAAGQSVLTYPERVRNPEGLGDFLPWTARLALAEEVAILPCHLRGTTQGDAGPARLMVGARLQPTGDAHSLTERLRGAIARMAER